MIAARGAEAQGFISPSIGYNFAGSAGCRTATDCRDKNWNWGGSLGALGSVVGFEVEPIHSGEFNGDSPNQGSSVTTLMANFMLAPRISIVQPFGVAGVGAIRTSVDNRVVGSSDSETDAGWTDRRRTDHLRAAPHRVEGRVRYYRSFTALDLLDIELARGRNSIDFGRAGFGMVFKF